MNWLLIIVAIIFLIFAIVGGVRGFLRVLFSLVSIIVLIVLVSFLTPHVSNFLTNNTNLGKGVSQSVSQKLQEKVENGIDSASGSDESDENTQYTEISEDNLSEQATDEDVGLPSVLAKYASQGISSTVEGGNYGKSKIRYQPLQRLFPLLQCVSKKCADTFNTAGRKGF